MRVITRDQVKTQLGITDNSLDSQIDAKLPIIDAKVKQITGNKYNYQIQVNMTNGSDIATITSVENVPENNWRYFKEDIQEYITAGDQLEGDGIPVETHVSEIYYNGDTVKLNSTQYIIPAIKLSNNATEDGVQDVFVGINIGYHDIIAKGVQYLISGTNTSLPQNRVKSKSLPPLSVTFRDSKIDPKTGMPDWFVEALPKYVSCH